MKSRHIFVKLFKTIRLKYGYLFNYYLYTVINNNLLRMHNVQLFIAIAYGYS